MTIYYVSNTDGNNSYDGSSPTFVSGTTGPKATLNGAEDIPVTAGDTVYVRAGTYRELLTVDVSGSGGSPITYIGDYAGSVFPTGGVVRITGSDNDQTAARANCITATTKTHRTFQGFQFDIVSGTLVSPATSCTNWIIDKCIFLPTAGASLIFSGASQANNTVQNCLFYSKGGANTVTFTHTITINDTAQTIQNCIFIGGNMGVAIQRVGGVTVKNSVIFNCASGIRVDVALAVGQVVTVNNCIIAQCTIGLQATTTAEYSENYNTLSANNTDRTNVTAGANSLAYPPLWDTRWFFQLVNEGAGPNSVTQVVTPFDLSSLSQLLNVAGTSPTTTDMRGTAVQSTQREWGALEYDSTLKIEGGGGGGSIFGGAVVR